MERLHSVMCGEDVWPSSGGLLRYGATNAGQRLGGQPGSSVSGFFAAGVDSTRLRLWWAWRGRKVAIVCPHRRCTPLRPRCERRCGPPQQYEHSPGPAGARWAHTAWERSRVRRHGTPGRFSVSEPYILQPRPEPHPEQGPPTLAPATRNRTMIRGGQRLIRSGSSKRMPPMSIRAFQRLFDIQIHSCH